MKKMSAVLKASLFFLFILFQLADYSHAEIYKYKDENGIWRYTDNPIELPEDSERMKGVKGSIAPKKDLQKQLYANLSQRNEIEKAACGVVAVMSQLGYGSGFFITDDGYIITNKHVLKGDENQKKIDQSLIDDVEKEIKKLKKDLDEEEKRLEAMKEKLEMNKRFIDSQPNSPAKKQNLKQYDYYLKKYKEWKNDFEEREKRFRAAEIKINDEISDYNYDRAMADISRYFKILVADDTELNVYLVSSSEKHDLALLKLDGYKTPFLKPANPQEISYGETVYAIGNPAKLRNSIAKGIISGFEGHLIKTDAKIYPGNSGGPLITRDGRVIGINSFKQLTRKFEGLGFAIPIQTAINEFRGELGNHVKFE
jgi:V8-like Glu-specific endopeptidase